jgi:hypothetical protein
MFNILKTSLPVTSIAITFVGNCVLIVKIPLEGFGYNVISFVLKSSALRILATWNFLDSEDPKVPPSIVGIRTLFAKI